MKKLFFILSTFLFLNLVQGQVYFHESFEGVPIGNLPAGWNVQNLSSSTLTAEWGVETALRLWGHTGTSVITEGYFPYNYLFKQGKALVAHTPAGSYGSQKELLTSPNITVGAGSGKVYLSFVLSFIGGHWEDSLYVMIFDGTAWDTLFVYDVWNNPFHYFNQDISSYVNPNLKIGFLYNFNGIEIREYGFWIDEIAVYRESPVELQAEEVYIKSDKVCPFTSSDTIAFRFSSSGGTQYQTAYNTRVHYQIYKDGNPVGNVITDTIDSIPPGTSITHLFSTPADLSLPGEYQIRAWIEDSNEFSLSNNVIVSKHYPLYAVNDTISYEESFDKDWTQYTYDIWSVNPGESFGNYNIYTYQPYASTFTWIQRFGEYHQYHTTGLPIVLYGPKYDRTRGYSGSPTDTLGGYMATVAGGSDTTAILYSPCFLLENSDPDMFPHLFTFYYHPNAPNVSKMECSFWSEKDSAWIGIGNAAPDSSATSSSPWELVSSVIDTSFYQNAPTRIKFEAFIKNPGAPGASLAIDGVSVGVPRDADFTIISMTTAGCPTGKDALAITLFSPSNYFISPQTPFIINLNVTGPTGNFSLQDTFIHPLPDVFASIWDHPYWAPEGWAILVTDSVFDFSTPGTYTVNYSFSHPQDISYANNSGTRTFESFETYSLKDPVDFTGYNGNNLNQLFPAWEEGAGFWLSDLFNFASQIGDEYVKFAGNDLNIPLTELYIKSAQQTQGTEMYAENWRRDSNSPNGTAGTFFVNTWQEKSEMLISNPIHVPNTSGDVKLIYDIAMLDFGDTLFSGMGGSGSSVFDVYISAHCGRFWQIDTNDAYLYKLLVHYDSASVNGKPLQQELRQGKTDTFDISHYAGDNISIVFVSSSSGNTNVPQKLYEVFLDNIRIEFPYPDVAAISLLNLPDTVCPEQTIQGGQIMLTNLGQSDIVPQFKILYDGLEIASAATQMLAPGDTLVEDLPDFSFGTFSFGDQEVLVVITNPYDTVASNDTLRKIIHVKDPSFYFSPAALSLTDNAPQICVKVNPDACDSVHWEIPAPLQIVSGGTAHSDSVCITASGGPDTTLTIKAVRFCNGCFQTKQIQVNVKMVTNIAFSEETPVKIYPNPVEETLTIEVPGRGIMEIYSVQGYGLYAGECKKKTEIDMSDFARGMYFVEVRTEEGIFRFKVIKE